MSSSNGLVNQVGMHRDFHLLFNEEGVIHLVIIIQSKKDVTMKEIKPKSI